MSEPSLTLAEPSPGRRDLLATLALPWMAAATAALPASPAGAQAGWQRIRFRDGSGSVALPPGWWLSSAQRATAEGQGPNGEAFALGVTTAVGPPQFAAPGVLAGPYLPHQQAFAWVNASSTQRSAAPLRVLRYTESLPTQPLTQGGQAEWLIAEMAVGQRPYKALALVNTAPLSPGYWQYYMTLMMAPAEVFAYALPVLIEIWKSWGISQGEMNRRLDQALATMAETNAIMRGTLAARQRPTPRQQEITGDTLRGYWVLEDRTTGMRFKVTVAEANDMMAREPGRYRWLATDER